MNAIYLRVSTDKQTSEMQERAISMFLESKQLKIDLTFQDEGFSGGSINRPGLNSLLEAVKESKIEVVVVYKLDRLFRSLRHLLATLDVFREYGTKLISISDNIDLTTPNGIFQMQIIGAFAELEKSMISERTKSGLANARAKGIKLGRPRKVGNQTIETIVNMYGCGHSMETIGAQLSLSKSTIYGILRKRAKVLSAVVDK